MPKQTETAGSPLENALADWFRIYATHALVGEWKMPPFRATLKGTTIELQITAGPKDRNREARTLRCAASALLVMAARFWGATRPAKTYASAPTALPSYSECQAHMNNTADWYKNLERDDDFEETILKLAKEISAKNALEGVLLLRRWLTIYHDEEERIPTRVRAAYFDEVGPAKALAKRQMLSPQIIAKLVAPYAESDDPLVQITIAMELIRGTRHLTYSNHDRYEALVGPMVKRLLDSSKGAVREATLSVAEHLAWRLWYNTSYAKAAEWFGLLASEEVTSPYVLQGLWACQYFLEDPMSAETWNRAMALASADGPGRGIHHTFDANKTPTRFRRKALGRIADCLEQMAEGKPTNPGGRGRVLKADKERAKAHGARFLARANAVRAEATALDKT